MKNLSFTVLLLCGFANAMDNVWFRIDRNDEEPLNYIKTSEKVCEKLGELTLNEGTLLDENRKIVVDQNGIFLGNAACSKNLLIHTSSGSLNLSATSSIDDTFSALKRIYGDDAIKAFSLPDGNEVQIEKNRSPLRKSSSKNSMNQKGKQKK